MKRISSRFLALGLTSVLACVAVLTSCGKGEPEPFPYDEFQNLSLDVADVVDFANNCVSDPNGEFCPSLPPQNPEPNPNPNPDPGTSSSSPYIPNPGLSSSSNNNIGGGSSSSNNNIGGGSSSSNNNIGGGSSSSNSGGGNSSNSGGGACGANYGTYDMAVAVGNCLNLTKGCTTDNNLPLKIYNNNHMNGTWKGIIYCSDSSSKNIVCGSTANLCEATACAAGTTGAWLSITEMTGTQATAESNCW